MNTSFNDSDDSAFLFECGTSKRKATNITGNKEKHAKFDKEQFYDSEAVINQMGMETSACINANSCLINKQFPNKTYGMGSPKTFINLDSGTSDVTLDKQIESNEEKNVKQKREILRLKNGFSCPLCLKKFDTQANQISHLKQCAKKNQVPVKELLEIFVSQQKSAAAIDCIPQIQPSFKKKEKKLIQEKYKSPDELALGLALSKSLMDTNVSDINSQISSAVNEFNSCTTLEKFGFTSSNKCYQGIGKKKVKKYAIHNYELTKRTEEERKMLVTEKASIILLSENDESGVSGTKYPTEKCRSRHKSSSEDKLETMHLWEIGENDRENSWYVEGIRDLVKGRVLPERKIESNEFHQVRDTRSFIKRINDVNLPRPSVINDWKKLINSQHFSDLLIRTKDGNTIYLHSVIIHARCPKALTLDMKCILSKYDSETVLVFLHYLYCGILHEKMETNLADLWDIANFLEWEELISVLNNLRENGHKKLETGDANRIHCSSCTDLYCTGMTLPGQVPRRPLTKDECECITSRTSHDGRCNHSNQLISASSDFPTNDTISSMAMDSQNNDSITVECPVNEHVFFKPMEEICKFSRERDANKSPENCHLMKRVPETKKLNELIIENETEPTDCTKCSNISQLEGIPNLNQTICDFSSEVKPEKDLFEDTEILNDRKISKSRIETQPSGMEVEHGVYENIPTFNHSHNYNSQNENNIDQLNKKNDTVLVDDFEVPYFDPYEHFNNDLHISDSPTMIGECRRLSTYLVENHTNGHSRCLSRENHQSQPIENSRSSVTIEDAPSSHSTPMGNHEQYFSYRLQDGPHINPSVNNNYPSIPKSTKQTAKSKLIKCDSPKDKETNIGCVRQFENSTEIFTESILKEFNNSKLKLDSLSNTISPNPNTEEFVHITPASSDDQYTDDVSPMPDYSMMGVSTMKKHLTKYGLKKNLSKNKAKRILRYIYEELHPIISPRNGKMINHFSLKSSKMSRVHKRVKSNLGTKIKHKPSLAVEGKDELQSQGDILPSDDSPASSALLKYNKENHKANILKTDVFSVTSDCYELPNNSSHEREFHMDEPNASSDNALLSSCNTSSKNVYDYIKSKPELYRRVLMYEPIWLEKLRKDLFDTYGHKYKLLDLMDYLDMECISFRHECQRRMGDGRRVRSKRSGRK